MVREGPGEDQDQDQEKPPSSPGTPPFYRVSERDMTEIELHTVDSINDLHRIHSEHSHKGNKHSRPSTQTPSPNGNLHRPGLTGVEHRHHPISSKWQSRLQDMLRPSSSRSYMYAMGCGIIALLLLAVILIFYFLVQQGGALQTLTEAVREKQAVSMTLTQLIQELQALRHNLTTLRGGT